MFCLTFLIVATISLQTSNSANCFVSEVFVLGHSLGLSDRTMLSMIFEHSNCKSIKIFYYEHDKGNNYVELTQEISKHFRNKLEMRRKIVPFDRSEPMPQAKS